MSQDFCTCQKIVPFMAQDFCNGVLGSRLSLFNETPFSKEPIFSVTYSSPMKLALKLTPITCNKYIKHENEELKQIAIFSFGPLMGGLLRLTMMIYCLKAELLSLLDMVVFISLVELLGFRVL